MARARGSCWRNKGRCSEVGGEQTVELRWEFKNSASVWFSEALFNQWIKEERLLLQTARGSFSIVVLTGNLSSSFSAL